MRIGSLLSGGLILALAATPTPGAADEATAINRAVSEAVRKTAALAGYAFKVEEQGPGTTGNVEGKYEKGKPIFFSADKLEFYKKGDNLVYKHAGRWQRSKTGTESDPLLILVSAAKVRGATLPSEQLPELIKGLKGLKKGQAGEDGVAVYGSTLDEEGAKRLAPPSMRSVARDGTATLHIGPDGLVRKYSLTIRMQGTLGNLEVDGQTMRSVTLNNHGTVRIELPEEAKKLLE